MFADTLMPTQYESPFDKLAQEIIPDYAFCDAGGHVLSLSSILDELNADNGSKGGGAKKEG